MTRKRNAAGGGPFLDAGEVVEVALADGQIVLQLHIHL